MTIKLIGRYNDDSSTTSISYKRYADVQENTYPSLSVCLKGDDLYRYNESTIFQAYKINPTEYKLLLAGKPAHRFKYDATRRLYNKTPLPWTYETNFTFEQMAKDSYAISDDLHKLRKHVGGSRSTVYTVCNQTRCVTRPECVTGPGV